MILHNRKYLRVTDYNGKIRWRKCSEIFSNVLAGAFGAFLANRGISVFNDAVRPVVPEYREGRMTRVEFATTTFALSFGLIIGFGIPYSIMSPLILVHSLWLGTDVIGIFFPAKTLKTGIRTKKV